MIPIARNRRVLLSALVAASFAQAALAAIMAFCVQRVFDTLLVHGAASTAPGAAALIGLVFAASALSAAGLEILRAWAGERLGLGYVAEVREQLFATIMRASPHALSQKRQGGLLLPFVGDLTAIKKWVSDGLVRFISATATTLLLIGVLAYQSTQMALAVTGVVILAAGAVVWLSRPLSTAIRDTRARRGAVANFVSSSIRAAQTIQAFDRFAREAQRLRKRSDALMISSLRLATVTGLMTSIVHLAAALLIATTLIVGVIEVRSGAMTIGVVAAAISIAGLLAGAVRDLGVAFELWRRGRVSFAKVGRALALEASVEISRTPRKITRNSAKGVELVGVSVEGVFKDVSASAKPGDVVHVVGDSGAGKSTLLALAGRLRDPDRGRVRLHGRDLRHAALGAVRKRIGMASIAMPLMRGSIAMNLGYRTDATDAEIARVIEVCNIDPILDKFPDREHARLSEGARELSLGEAQRILIARAIMGRPSILILDDVDTHLDGETAARIAAELKDYPGVVLMAATSPALRRVATATWRITDGGVSVEEGPAKVIDIVPANSEEPCDRAVGP